MNTKNAKRGQEMKLRIADQIDQWFQVTKS
jgi:hypothetical protein